MKKIILSFIGIALIATACGTSVRILGSWSSPSKSAEGYEKVFVTALTENVLARQLVEKDLEGKLNEKGVDVMSSMEIIPPGYKAKKADKDEILPKIKALGSEVILTVALLDQKNETRYVPGNAQYAPMGFGAYGNFWNYYSFYNPYMYDPGYYTTDKIYYLEANLYDVQSEKLIWSSQSETTNPSSLENFSMAFSNVIVKQLIKDGLIQPTE